MAIINFIKAHKILFVFFSFIFLAAFVVYFALPNQPKQNTVNNITPNRTIGLNGLLPNKSSRDDVLKQLGQPLFETRNGDTTTDQYKSTSPTRNHEVVYNKEQVVYIKQIVSTKDSLSVNDMTNLYGQPDNVLYGRESDIGYNLYVYLAKGVAYLGNQTSGTLLEVWYFPTTNNLQTFMNQWATGYSLTMPSSGF